MLRPLTSNAAEAPYGRAVESIRTSSDHGIVADLRQAGLERGGFLALAIAPNIGLAVAVRDGTSISTSRTDPCEVVRHIEAELRPRWVLWGAETRLLVTGGVRVAKSWNIAAVHRLLHGGWRADPARVWASLHALDIDSLPVVAPVDLFTQPSEVGHGDEPVRADGYLEPLWLTDEFEWSVERLSRWARLAGEVGCVARRLPGRPPRPAKGAVDGQIRIRRRVALRRALRRWAADGSIDSRGDHRLVHRPAAADRH